MKLSDLIEQLETCRRHLGDNGGEAEIEVQLYDAYFDFCDCGTIEGAYETFNKKVVIIGNITDINVKKVK